MPAFDTFLSHNTEDKVLIRQLKTALQKNDLQAWLDEDEIAPGQLFQDRIAEGMEQSRTAIAAYGAAGPGPWQAEEVRVLLQHSVREGKTVIPVLLPGAPAEPELPPFLAQRNWVDMRGGITDEGVRRLIWGITGNRGGELIDEVENLSELIKENDPNADRAPAYYQPVEKGFTRQSMESAAAKITQVIDSDILEVIIENIRKAKDRLVEVLGSDKPQQVKDEALEYAKYTICAELRRIRDLNEEQLPTPELEKAWVSNRCAV